MSDVSRDLFGPVDDTRNLIGQFVDRDIGRQAGDLISERRAVADDIAAQAVTDVQYELVLPDFDVTGTQRVG